MPIGAAIAGAATSAVLGSALAPDQPTAPSSTPVTYPGAEFQPYTYTGTGGFGVTGTPEGEYGYNWEAQIPDWLKNLGKLGAGQAGDFYGMFAKQSKVDPYQAAQEFYNRGLAQLQPELAKQQIQAQERMFGSGRLGLKLAGEAVGAPTGTGMVNPDAFGLAAGQAKSLQDLYTKSLSEGQRVQTNYINQLKGAADTMLALGMKPSEVEQALIKFGVDTETARSNAIKGGTSMSNLKETSESALMAKLASELGGAASDYVGQGMQTGDWSLFGDSSSNIYGNPTAAQWSNNYAATGGSNNFGYGQGNTLMTGSQPIQNYTPSTYNSGAMIYTP